MGVWQTIKYLYVPYLKITKIKNDSDHVLVKGVLHPNVVMTKSQAIDLATSVDLDGKRVKAPYEIMKIVEGRNYDPLDRW